MWLCNKMSSDKHFFISWCLNVFNIIPWIEYQRQNWVLYLPKQEGKPKQKTWNLGHSVAGQGSPEWLAAQMELMAGDSRKRTVGSLMLRQNVQTEPCRTGCYIAANMGHSPSAATSSPGVPWTSLQRRSWGVNAWQSGGCPHSALCFGGQGFVCSGCSRL